MNLARLEQMIREGDMSREAFIYLLGCRGECEWLDYKITMSLESDYELCSFARDVVGMKNVGGGYIVAGVKDKTWEQVGLPAQLPYDTKMLRDKVVRATGLTLDVDIVHHSLTDGGKTAYFPLILVRPSKKRQKRRTPSVVSKDFCHTQPYGFRRGDIWVRKGDSTVKVSSDDELEELLDRLEEQADEQSIALAEHPSPFAVEDGTYKLLDKGYDNFVGRVELRNRLRSALENDPR
jgi:hypothetical protein